MKRERVEDLGVIKEKLCVLIDDFEGRFPFFDSKHSYDDFVKYFETDTACIRGSLEIHCSIRHLLEKLWEIYGIAHGDDCVEE